MLVISGCRILNPDGCGDKIFEGKEDGRDILHMLSRGVIEEGTKYRRETGKRCVMREKGK